MARPTTYWINFFGKKYGIDPKAAIAVARGEGGLVNRQGDVGDLGGGGSYGPFQLYSQGALPSQYRGKPQQADAWAWSPQGVDYAMRKMKESGAGGLTGAQAVNAIVRRFERPADPNKSVAAALGRLGVPYDPGGDQAVPAGGGAGGDPQAARRAFAMAMIGQVGKKTDAMGALRAMQAAQGAGASTQEMAPSELDPRGNPMSMLKQLGVADAITSSVRSPAANAATGGAAGSHHLPGGLEAYDLKTSAAGRVAAHAKAHPGQYEEFFYDPLGWYIKKGKVYKGRIGGHSDHAHVVYR